MSKRLILLLIAVVSFETLLRADDGSVDVLLKGGTVIDGTGSAGRVVNVALTDGKIVGVGELKDVEAQWTIDCEGMVVCPGFIDLHNHSDRQIVEPETRAAMNYVTQGCTTIVTGNCGSGPVNVAEFYDAVDEHGAGPNVAHLLPQGGLRLAVIGTELRDPTDAELKRMLELTEQAMQDGAWGMSTGLIYVPSSYAKTDELISVAKVVSAYGGIYASHIRGEGTGVLGAIDEALKIGREADLPVHVSHFKSSGRDAWGLVRQAAAMIQKARDTGRSVTADQYPYIASSTSLHATLLPAWARAGGQEALLKRLDGDEVGPKLREIVAEAIENRSDGDALRIARYRPRQDWVGLSLLAIAQKEKRPVIDIAYEIFRSGGAAIVNFSMSEDDVRHIMAIDWVATASDGRAYLPGSDRPHPRNYGTFPRKVGYYALQEDVISMEHAIRSSTSLPAKILGLTDRGEIKVGQAADVVVFDPDTVKDRATFDDPHQYSRGLRYVFVNGTAAVARGEGTGALAGRALRHESTEESK